MVLVIYSKVAHRDGVKHCFVQCLNDAHAWIIRPVNQRLIFLNVLVAAAPLMGLLGTVIGMLGTFVAISSGGGAETASMVAAGISEALITTQTGLFVALPGLFLAMVVRRRKHSVEAALARIESLVLSKHKFDLD